MSLLSRQPAIASARAATKCFAIEIPAGVFYQIVALHGEALDWVKALAEDRRVKMGSIAEGKETFEEITLDIV
jgi:CRP-like cAMP-binding protein